MSSISNEPSSYLKAMKTIEIRKPGATSGCLAEGGGGINLEHACRPNLNKSVTGGNSYS